MARSKSSSTAMTEMFKQAREFMPFNPMVGPQVEHFWEAQDNILSEMETFAQHWFERRHTATRTALDTVRDATRNGASDPAGSIKAMSEWQAHSMERIAQDFKECFDLCSNCAGHLTRAEMEAGEEGLEKATKNVKSAASKKSSAPV